MQVEPDIPASEEEAKRASTRINFFLSTVISAEGVSEVVARVRNLSAGGMMIEVDAELNAGDAIVAQLRGIGKVKGVVAWAATKRFGIAFARPIDPELARKPVGLGGEVTPDFIKPVLVPSRSLKYIEGLRGD